MSELRVKIPKRFDEIMKDELEKPATKLLLSNAVEDKLNVLLLFKVVDDILKGSKLSKNNFDKPKSYLGG